MAMDTNPNTDSVFSTLQEVDPLNMFWTMADKVVTVNLYLFRLGHVHQPLGPLCKWCHKNTGQAVQHGPASPVSIHKLHTGG
jgi:hypothetical protein